MLKSYLKFSFLLCLLVACGANDNPSDEPTFGTSYIISEYPGLEEDEKKLIQTICETLDQKTQAYSIYLSENMRFEFSLEYKECSDETVQSYSTYANLNQSSNGLSFSFNSNLKSKAFEDIMLSEHLRLKDFCESPKAYIKNDLFKTVYRIRAYDTSNSSYKLVLYYDQADDEGGAINVEKETLSIQKTTDGSIPVGAVTQRELLSKNGSSCSSDNFLYKKSNLTSITR